MVYYMRTTPKHILGACKAFDDLLARSLQGILPFSLSASALAQARLELSQGGLGLRATVDHTPDAYVALDCSVQDVASLLCPSFIMLPEASKALDHLNSLYGEEWQLEACSSQKEFSATIDNSFSRRKLLKDLNSRSKANLLTCSRSHSGDWLVAVFDDVAFKTQEWTLAVARRLSIPVLSQSHRCGACRHNLDVYRDHALRCANQGNRIARHNAIRDKLFYFADSALLTQT